VLLDVPFEADVCEIIFKILTFLSYRMPRDAKWCGDVEDIHEIIWKGCISQRERASEKDKIIYPLHIRADTLVFQN